jgi:2-methylisocitrate lyase-like PEP mutase family enzyme
MNDRARRLRELLAGDDMIAAPFVYDGLQAKVAVAAGFPAVYMTGFGTAAARGYPDVGLLTMSEMVANVRTVAEAVSVPVICDADTGYGNPLNVMRTVREYEHAGAAALHIEDQIWPKRCGFLAGKQVVATGDMVAKVRAACDARRDGQLVIIARTDALQPHGWEEAETRARAYRDAGADLIFVDGISTVDDLHTYAHRLGDLPLLYNGLLRPLDDIARLGFRVTIHPGTLAVVYTALRDALAELKASGRIAGTADLTAFAEIFRLLGVAETLERAARYDAPGEVRGDRSTSRGG